MRKKQGERERMRKRVQKRVREKERGRERELNKNHHHCSKSCRNHLLSNIMSKSSRHAHECVTLHIDVCDVTLVNASWHVCRNFCKSPLWAECEELRPQMSLAGLADCECVSRIQHTLIVSVCDAYNTHSHSAQKSRRIQMSHATHNNESRHTYKWVTSHIKPSHVTRTNESRHTYNCVTSHALFIEYRHLFRAYRSLWIEYRALLIKYWPRWLVW